MGRQKIAIVTPGSFVIPSGRSSSVERVIEKIAPLTGAHMEVCIYGLEGQGLPLNGMIGGIPCYRLPGGRLYADSVLMHLRRWLPDRIDVHNRPQLAYRLKMGLPRTKVFLTLHSTTFISSGLHSGIGMQQMLQGLDGFIVNSEYLRSLIVQRFPNLKPKVFVNHLGVSLEDFIPRWTTIGEGLRSARLSDLGWSKRKIVLYVGRLLPAKGVHHLIEIWPTVMRQERNALLLIVGSAYYGGDRENGYVRRLKAKAELLGDHVVFLPFVPYSQIAAWYNLADIVVVPSSGEEAFGLVNVEAMASAVPIIASDNGGIPEVVKHNETGFLVPEASLKQGFTNYIIRLLGNEDERTRMGRAGRELVRSRFRWQYTANRWQELMTRKIEP
ncbi:Spore coat protein SA [compost metagenome]